MRTFPVVLGRGESLFGEAAKPSGLRLVKLQTSATGDVMSIYIPDGNVGMGSFASDERSERELARRKKNDEGDVVI